MGSRAFQILNVSPQRRLTSVFDLENPGGPVAAIYSFRVQARYTAIAILFDARKRKA